MKEKGQDLKEQVTKAKDAFMQMPKKKRYVLGGVLGGIVLLAVVITVMLNVGKGSYKVLYQGLEAEEKNTIYNMLQEMGVPAQRNAQGDITVPAKEYDRCLLELASKGYPHSAPAYGLFESHSGMTTTEAENKQWILYQLQDRIQTTLKHLSGVQNAIVTINMPEQTSYVWEAEDQKTPATASVMLTLTGDIKPVHVSAIKNLVASGVPNLQAENVKVVDSRSMRELRGEEDSAAGVGSGMNLELETQLQERIEQNAIRALVPRYGPEGVFATASVTIDYDKMLTEEMRLQPKDDGTGFVKNFSEDYNLTGRVPAGGIVGEENNTDIPNQAYDTDENGNPMTSYNRDIVYDYGYIKTQIEKGNAVLKSGTISVMVDEANMTEVRRQELIDLISKSTGIEPEDISVSPIDPNAVPEEEPEAPAEEFPFLLYVLIGSGILLAILLLVLLVARSKKKKLQKERERQQNELDAQRAQMEQEIAAYKKELSDAALASTNPKEEAIVKEVREFAKENPEVTANLLRSWLKEEES